MIAVYSRIAAAANNDDDRAAAVQGRWANVSDRTRVDQVGQPLIGVASNEVVWVGIVVDSQRGTDGRVQFETRAPTADEATELESHCIRVAGPAPQWAQWRPGQANPVRIGPLLPVVRQPTQIQGLERVSIGGSTLTWSSNRNELHIDCPRGVRLVVTGR